MPQNVVDADTWTATVQCRADGEAVDGAGQLLLAQDLADRSLFVKNRVPGAAATYVLKVPVMLGPIGTARFTQSHAGIYQSDITDAGAEHIPIFGLPSFGTITTFTAYVDGLYDLGAAHPGLVGNPPRIYLGYKDKAVGGSAVSFAMFVDDPFASANLAAYEVPHSISPGAPVAHVINANYSYFFRLFGESGGNETADKFAVYGFDITITV